MKEAAKRGGLISRPFVGVGDFASFRIDQTRSAANRAIHRHTDCLKTYQTIVDQALHVEARYGALKDQAAQLRRPQCGSHERGQAADRIAWICFCSMARVSPHAGHRKVCSSGNPATLGVMKASTIGLPHVRHGNGSRSLS